MRDGDPDNDDQFLQCDTCGAIFDVIFWTELPTDEDGDDPGLPFEMY